MPLYSSAPHPGANEAESRIVAPNRRNLGQFISSSVIKMQTVLSAKPFCGQALVAKASITRRVPAATVVRAAATKQQVR
jgi:hypothetical protein